MLTRAFFQGLSIAAEPARPLFGDGFLSTRTEGPTNLGRCTYVSVSDLTCGSGLELVVTWNVTSERYLQGRKLERDFPVRWARNRVLGLASENILGGRNFSRFPLSQSAPRKNSRASGVAWGSWRFFGGSCWWTAPIPKRTTVGDRRALNSKWPKRVGSFGSSTDFLVKGKSVGSDMFR
jgi:hypothetical protein